MKNRSTLLNWIRIHQTWLGLGGFVVLAAYFRLHQLDSLPPGLYTAEANVGLATLNLLRHGTLPGWGSATGYAPLWVWLEALPVWVLGHSAFALRVMPALIGTAAVPVTWLWAKDWFNSRIAWVAATVMAVTPWSVTISRNGLPTVLAFLLVPLVLWLTGRAIVRSGLKWQLWLGGVLLIALLSGPLGWMLAILVLALMLSHYLATGRPALSRERLIGAGAAALAVVIAALSLALSHAHLRHFTTANGISLNPVTFLKTVGQVFAMFFIHGDDNFRHNFNGEPMLNAFIGLMLVAGILAAASRYAQRRYQVILASFVVLLVPAFISTVGVPNAAHAAAALPVIAVLVGIGVSYMLELWYATFPINSAARTVGLSMIAVLLAITCYQGYAQYFTAWANTGDTFTAYDDGAAQIAGFMQSTSFTGTRYLVATSDELPVVEYLANGQAFQFVSPAGINTLTTAAGGKQFIITAAVLTPAAHNVSVKYPGGSLLPYYSSDTQQETYYVYLVKP